MDQQESELVSQSGLQTVTFHQFESQTVTFCQSESQFGASAQSF